MCITWLGSWSIKAHPLCNCIIYSREQIKICKFNPLILRYWTYFAWFAFNRICLPYNWNFLFIPGIFNIGIFLSNLRKLAKASNLMTKDISKYRRPYNEYYWITWDVDNSVSEWFICLGSYIIENLSYLISDYHLLSFVSWKTMQTTIIIFMVILSRQMILTFWLKVHKIILVYCQHKGTNPSQLVFVTSSSKD